MSQEQNNDFKRPEPQGPRGRNGAMQGKIRFEKDTGKTLLRLLSYFKGAYMARFILALSLIVVNAFVSVKSASFLGTIIDDCIAPMLLESSPSFAPLLSAIAKMAAIFGVGILAQLGSNILMSQVTNHILYTLRTELFNHMQTLPIKYFDTHKYGDLMSRYTNDVDNIRQMMSQSIPQVFSTLISVVVIFIAMVKLNLLLTGIVILFIVLIYTITMTIGGQSAKYFMLRQKTLGQVNAHVEEMISGQKVVKVFCHEDECEEEFAVKNEDLFEKTSKANAFSNVLGPITANINHVQYAVIAIAGSAIAISSGGSVMSLGNIATFLNYSTSFARPISMVSQQINSVVMALAGAKRVFDVIDEKSEVDDGYVTLVKVTENLDGTFTETDGSDGVWAWKHPHHDGKLDYIKLCGDIRMQEVDFAYEPGKTVLHDITLFAKPGQKIAFVGSTGAGKTTITNLINRFYDIEDGKIRYDGININKIKKADLRRSLGMVLQDTNLFTGSIMDNIRYGRLDATDEEVISAAKLANADRFIRQLPDGYNTIISGTGSQLSQGQCQLLAIARCAVANPPAMILDEATSSIDTRTEKLIQEGMDALMGGRTVFVIAHRLSTIQNSNAIMVLENGRIIERGDHDELIEAKGRYYQLYTGKTS